MENMIPYIFTPASSLMRSWRTGKLDLKEMLIFFWVTTRNLLLKILTVHILNFREQRFTG